MTDYTPQVTSTTHGSLTNTTVRHPQSPSHVLAYLHNHQNLICLNPLVTKVAPIKQGDNYDESEAVFMVTDRMLLLGCIPANTTYRATFSDQKNGIWVNTAAALAIETSSVWVVEDDPEVKGGSVITESFELVNAPWWCRKFVEKTAKDAHKEMLEKLGWLHFENVRGQELVTPNGK